MRFQKILCPIDFSAGAQQAMAAAIRLANEHEAELVLFHSWHIPAVALPGEFVADPTMVQQLADNAAAGLEDAVATATKLGAKRVSAKLGNGTPWMQIVELAKADAAVSMIVIGSHGRTGLKRVLLGSVAEMVVRHAPCPVLTIRGEPQPFTHVLCPIDFSPRSRDAVDLAVALVQAGGVKLTLLHVLEMPVAWGELRPFDQYLDIDTRTTALLEGWVKEVSARVRIPVVPMLRVGSAGAQLLAALDDDPSYDLVVMGSHGRTGIARLALGSVAEKTVRHARCSVAVVHHRA